MEGVDEPWSCVMMAILLAVAPGIYAWYVSDLGEAAAVAIVLYGVFLAFAWQESRKIEPIDFVFMPLQEDMRRRRLYIILQIVVSSIIGWPLAWLLNH